jgi:hypothetical protein
METSSARSASTFFPYQLTPQLGHWEAYLTNRTWPQEQPVDALTPFHGTRAFQKLTASQKYRLFWGFVQINAEVIIHLEQTLLLSHRGFHCHEKRTEQALSSFIADERLHIQLFRDYLHDCAGLNWPAESLLLHRRAWFREACMWLYRFEPLAPFLPAAKSEIYAIQYFHTIKAHLPQDQRWAQLIRLHAQDEAAHITVDFAILEEQLSGMPWPRVVRLYAGTFLAVMMTQVCLLYSAWNLMAQVFNGENALARLRRTLGFVHWTLNVFGGFKTTRRIFSQMLAKKRHAFFRHFAFMGW